MSGGPAGTTALLLGATGLVGSACLTLLLTDGGYARVRVLLRRPLLPRPESPLLETHQVDFARPETYAQLTAVDHVYCAIGTTIKKARTQEAFRRVDLEIPLTVARLARDHGAGHFLLVSAIGADPRARTFYSRVKGELEEALRGLHYPSLTIIRPSLLLGQRAEWRTGERIGALGTPLIPARWKPVQAHRVAEALVAAGREDRPGIRYIENLELHRPRGS